MKLNQLAWHVVIFLFLLIFLPSTFQKGMFLDGVTYAAISRNLANHLGSFFTPHYTDFLYPKFYEHPPLFFIIQSSFFRIIGDYFFTEKIYGLVTFIVLIFGIKKNWDLLATAETKPFVWISIMLLFSVPIISWSNQNNMIENTLSVFTTWTVFLILKSIIENKQTPFILGSILIGCAYYTKGVVGLFPLITPIALSIVLNKNIPKSIVFLTIKLWLISIFGIILPILISEELRNSMSSYYETQVIPSLLYHRDATSNSHLYLLGELVLQLIIPISIFIIFKFINRKDKNNEIKAPLFFLFIGLSASLPLLISTKQRSFYLVPALVFYVLAVGLYITPSIKNMMSNLHEKRILKIKYLLNVMIVSVVVYSFFSYGNYMRKEEKIAEYYQIANSFPYGSTIHTDWKLCEDWELIAYMARIKNLSLDCEKKRDFVLLPIQHAFDDSSYERMNVQLNHYALYKRKTKD